MQKPNAVKFGFVLGIVGVLLLGIQLNSSAQNLDSNNYRILDPTVDSGGGTADSPNFSALFSAGNPTADARLTSGSYELKAGFPNGILANVPIINCFEADTNSGNTTCNFFPNANGAQGECGSPGCYDRVKLEIDDQDNPIDTVFLVRIQDTTNNVTYFLQSDHTLATGYDINDFMTQCQLEGRDNDDSACDDSGDLNWDETLQRYNVFGLEPNTTYQVSVSALSGDFTGTRYSTTLTETTLSPSITFDLDVSSTDSETTAPYDIDLGELVSAAPTTATDLIWLDLGTNAVAGANVFVRDLNNGLDSALTGETVPSESEDLSVDPNSNGGFGIKIASSTQTTLGPIQTNATYDTAGAQEVGALTATNTLLFYTSPSGPSFVGPISGGRVSLEVKARSANNDIAAPDLTDELTFIAVGNF